MTYVSTVRCETHDAQLGPVQQYEDHEDHETSGLCFGVSQAHLAKHPDCRVVFTRETPRAHARRLEQERAAELARAQEGAEYARKTMQRSAERWRARQDAGISRHVTRNDHGDGSVLPFG